MLPAAPHLAILRREQLIDSLDIVCQHRVHGSLRDASNRVYQLLTEILTVRVKFDQQIVWSLDLIVTVLRV